MKSWMIATLLTFAPLAAVHANAEIAVCSTEVAAMHTDVTVNAPQHGYKELSADQLKAWYDEGKKIVVVDARGKKYFDGNLLPNSKSILPEATDAEIQATLPEKDAVIVVYCSNLQCPAGGMLADRLVKMGYTHVYKLPTGIADWMQKGFPTVKHS
jgi:rhodanese-related sulfurtransferase